MFENKWITSRNVRIFEHRPRTPVIRSSLITVYICSFSNSSFFAPLYMLKYFIYFVMYICGWHATWLRIAKQESEKQPVVENKNDIERAGFWASNFCNSTQFAFQFRRSHGTGLHNDVPLDYDFSLFSPQPLSGFIVTKLIKTWKKPYIVPPYIGPIFVHMCQTVNNAIKIFRLMDTTSVRIQVWIFSILKVNYSILTQKHTYHVFMNKHLCWALLKLSIRYKNNMKSFEKNANGHSRNTHFKYSRSNWIGGAWRTEREPKNAKALYRVHSEHKNLFENIFCCYLCAISLDCIVFFRLLLIEKLIPSDSVAHSRSTILFIRISQA